MALPAQVAVFLSPEEHRAYEALRQELSTTQHRNHLPQLYDLNLVCRNDEDYEALWPDDAYIKHVKRSVETALDAMPPLQCAHGHKFGGVDKPPNGDVCPDCGDADITRIDRTIDNLRREWRAVGAPDAPDAPTDPVLDEARRAFPRPIRASGPEVNRLVHQNRLAREGNDDQLVVYVPCARIRDKLRQIGRAALECAPRPRRELAPPEAPALVEPPDADLTDAYLKAMDAAVLPTPTLLAPPTESDVSVDRLSESE